MLSKTSRGVKDFGKTSRVVKDFEKTSRDVKDFGTNSMGENKIGTKMPMLGTGTELVPVCRFGNENGTSSFFA